MLNLVIGEECYDEETSTFSIVDGIDLQLEHSLLALSKWESLVERPFLSKEEKTPHEVRQYVEAMIISPNPPPGVVQELTQDQMELVNEYIGSAQTATKFGTMPEVKGRGETITSELIYYWMVAFNIPFECERWHLNRLFALIRICNLKNSKPKKMSRQELAERNRALNEQRRQELNTRG